MATWREFEAEGIPFKFVGVSRYMGAYMGTREEFEAWVLPQMEEWAHIVRTLCKLSF